MQLTKTKSQVLDVAGRYGKPVSKSSMKARSNRYGDVLPLIEDRLTASKRKFSSTKTKLNRFPY